MDRLQESEVQRSQEAEETQQQNRSLGIYPEAPLMLTAGPSALGMMPPQYATSPSGGMGPGGMPPGMGPMPGMGAYQTPFGPPGFYNSM